MPMTCSLEVIPILLRYLNGRTLKLL